jgi:hypothetical protein
MPPDTMEDTAVEQASEDTTGAVGRTVDALEGVAQDVGETITQSIPAAIVGVMDRMLAGQSRTNQLIEAVDNKLTENLNALSRAQANTDISAQRAAEAAGTIADELEPPEETSPDQGEQPAKLKELPTSQERPEEAKAKWWYGKAARRHGKNG